MRDVDYVSGATRGEMVQDVLSQENLTFTELESLYDEVKTYNEGEIVFQKMVAHPDVPVKYIHHLKYVDVSIFLENPVFPLLILENPSLFHQINHPTLLCFIDYHKTPEWVLHCLKNHPDSNIAQAAMLHRLFFIPSGNIGDDCRKSICNSPLPQSSYDQTDKDVSRYPDVQRRRFAAMPSLPAWAVVALGGNPERVFSEDRLSRMRMDATKSEDNFLVFLACALPWAQHTPTSTIAMASSHHWAQRLAAAIRPETPEEAIIVLADDTNALVYAIAKARMEGKDAFMLLWED
jgi:hypothetical protein